MLKTTSTLLALALLGACNSGSEVLQNTDADPLNADANTEASSTPPDCRHTASLGQAFAAASGDQSDPLFTPAASIDGCADSDSSWAGNQGESLVLDAGSAVLMQGVYVWTEDARSEWLSIEQSNDGQQWSQTWRRVRSQHASGSSYFSLEAETPTRYLRVRGYGSNHNAWTTITEARWSLSGAAVSGPRAWRHSDSLVALHSGDQRAASPLYQKPLSSLFVSCPYTAKPVFVDATGTLESFWRYDLVANTPVYSFDWNHYPLDAEPDFFAAPDVTYEPLRHAQAMLSPFAAADPLVLFNTDCGASIAQDALHLSDEMLAQAQAGLMPVVGWH